MKEIDYSTIKNPALLKMVNQVKAEFQDVEKSTSIAENLKQNTALKIKSEEVDFIIKAALDKKYLFCAGNDSALFKFNELLISNANDSRADLDFNIIKIYSVLAESKWKLPDFALFGIEFCIANKPHLRSEIISLLKLVSQNQDFTSSLKLKLASRAISGDQFETRQKDYCQLVTADKINLNEETIVTLASFINKSKQEETVLVEQGKNLPDSVKECRLDLLKIIDKQNILSNKNNNNIQSIAHKNCSKEEKIVIDNIITNSNKKTQTIDAELIQEKINVLLKNKNPSFSDIAYILKNEDNPIKCLNILYANHIKHGKQIPQYIFKQMELLLAQDASTIKPINTALYVSVTEYIIRQNYSHVQDSTVTNIINKINTPENSFNLNQLLFRAAEILITSSKADLATSLISKENSLSNDIIFKSLSKITAAENKLPKDATKQLISLSVNIDVPANIRHECLTLIHDCAHNLSKELLAQLAINTGDKNLSIAQATTSIIRDLADNPKTHSDLIKLLQNITSTHSEIKNNITEILSDLLSMQSTMDSSKLEQNSIHLTNDTLSISSNITEDIEPVILSKPFDSEELINQISKLNDNNPEIKELASNGMLSKQLMDVYKYFKQDSTIFPQGKNIESWQENELLEFTKALIDQPEEARKQENMMEIISIISQANQLHNNYKLRDTQILSILVLIQSSKGRLAQISTGEGKSTTTASLAAIKALQGHEVDIITSSPLLAKRDAYEWNDFFKLLNLSCSHNIDPDYRKGAKECYQHKIVYGDVATFQGDWLKTIHKDLETCGSRKIDNIIIDEVDSMLIDGSNKLVKLSSPLVGAEYLSPIFVSSWHTLSNLSKQCIYLEDQQTHAFIAGNFEYQEGKLTTDKDSFENITPIEDIDKFKSNYIESYITDLIEKRVVIIPNHLKNTIAGEVKDWSKSAVLAEKYQIKKDYLIVQNTRAEDIIAPIDYLNTGIVQANTVWENGLQQFLQVKHNLKITAKSDTTSFISNMTYFRLYGDNISGLTGTLGSNNSRKILQDVYNLDCAFIPTYKAKQFTEYQPILVENKEQHLKEVVNSTKQFIQNNRSVLVICKTISDVDILEQALKKTGEINNILRYSRNDNEEHLITRNKIDVGTVIVATNLAGRGTDLKITNRLASEGGLHVCVIFMPSNSRIEEQAFGRSARDGNAGSGQLIINRASVVKSFKPYIEQLKLDPEQLEIKHLKVLRDLKENNRLENSKLIEVPKLELNDKLFGMYNQLYKQLKQSDDNQYKLMQLSEDWGNVFRTIRKEYNNSELPNDQKEIKSIEVFENFKSEASKNYHANTIISNPAYIVMQGFNALGKNNEYTESISLLSKAIELDDIYSFAARYNRAYAMLREGYKSAVGADKAYGGYIQYHQNVLDDLGTVKAQIEGVLIPSFQSMQIILPQLADNPLSSQIHNKIGLMQLVLSHTDNAIAAIQNGDVNEAMKVGDNPQILESFFDNKNMPRSEIEELQNWGIHRLYNISNEEIGSHLTNSIAVCILSLAQTVVGALAIASGNVALGVSLVSSGVKDLYSASSVKQGGGAFRWNDYFVNKGIDLAVHYLTIGAEKLLAVKNTTTISNEALKKNIVKDTVITEVKKEVKNQAIKKAIIQTAISTIANIAINNVSKSIIKDKQRDIVGSIDKKIKSTLTRSSIKEALQHIITMDHYAGNTQYQDNIIAEMQEFLTTKRHIFADISSRLVSSLMHSQNSGISIIATGIKGTEIIHEFNKVLSLADEFCEEIKRKVTQNVSYSPKFEDLILKSIRQKGLFSQTDAKNIIDILKQGEIWNGEVFNKSKLGFIEGISIIQSEDNKKSLNNTKTETFILPELKTDNKIEQTKNHTLQNIPLEKYEPVRERIIEVVHKLHKSISYDKSSKEIEIANRLTNMLSSAINNRITGKVIMPITSGIIQNFSSNLAEKWSKDLKQEQSRFMGAKDELEENFLIENYLKAGYSGIGVSAGDDYSDNKIKIYDAKDDVLIDARGDEDIPKLVSINKLEENKEFNTMLRAIQDYQHEDKQVPIFDVSNKTNIIPKTNTGFSFVNSAHANSMGSIATTMGGGIIGQDLALAIAFKTSTFLSKAPIAMGIVGAGRGLHNAAQFEAQHPLLSPEFNDIMTNPYISQKDKDSYWQKATNDPLFITRSNSVINMPVMQTELSGLLKEIRMDIDPNAGKPSLETFPVHYQPKSILFTPDDSDKILQRGQLPGFIPTPIDPSKLLESFPIHEQDWKDLILYKKIDLDYDKLSKKHFDNDVRYIHGKKYEGAKITDINPDVAERMSGLIITDKSGKIRGVHNTQDHHIIHQATKGAKELFEELGLDIDAVENRSTLPSDIKLTEHEITKMTQHVGKHDKEILDKGQAEILNIKKSLQEGALDTKQAKERLLDFIQKQRHELESGEQLLNSVGRK
tara:strand:+ start:6160 stop:13401 length:7242 start_codon:yes stop_codon:yes gene_type:complete